ncbi:hypothetical protein NOVOSPHI9U_50198 [Novosphingobium sp. 9U]|nr:hypothetical protein NOVOSPHI9U_50198 [Novosphingobium sp. 9U]
MGLGAKRVRVIRLACGTMASREAREEWVHAEAQRRRGVSCLAVRPLVRRRLARRDARLESGFAASATSSASLRLCANPFYFFLWISFELAATQNLTLPRTNAGKAAMHCHETAIRACDRRPCSSRS